MGRAAGLSLAEQRTKAAKRAAHLKLIQYKRDLKKILEVNPHLHEEMVAHANALGYYADAKEGTTLKELDSVKQGKKQKKVPAIEDNSTSTALAVSKAAAPGLGDKKCMSPSPSPQKELTTNALINQECHIVVGGLQAIEPHFCRDAALKAAFAVGGKRKMDFMALCRLLSYATGWNMLQDMTEELENLEQWHQHLKDEAALRGNRLQSTPLPPQYDNSIFRWIPDDGELIHTWTSETIALDDRMKEGLGDLFAAVITSPWSEQDATLRVSGKPYRIRLGDLFKSHAVAQPMKKQKLKNSKQQVYESPKRKGNGLDADAQELSIIPCFVPAKSSSSNERSFKPPPPEDETPVSTLALVGKASPRKRKTRG